MPRNFQEIFPFLEADDRQRLLGAITRAFPREQGSAGDLYQQALRLQDGPEKLALLRKAVDAASPPSTELLITTLRLALQIGTADEIERYFTLAEAYPGSWQFQFLRGIHHGQAGRTAEARAAFLSVLDRAPRAERGEICYNLGFCAEIEEDFNAAASYYQEAIDTAGALDARTGIALVRVLRKGNRIADALPVAQDLKRLFKEKGHPADGWKELLELYRAAGLESERAEAERVLRALMKK